MLLFLRDAKQNIKEKGVKIHQGKPRTPEHQAYIERANRIIGADWKDVVLNATREERENWGVKLLPKLRAKLFERKFRKFGGEVTVFENVYGYPRNIKDRKVETISRLCCFVCVLHSVLSIIRQEKHKRQKKLKK